MTSRPRLPPSFTNLYRLFLRASSASVLHHFQARKHLRKLWRPSFEDAAAVRHRFHSSSVNSNERKCLENWLHIWENRMDNTLSLLLVSARSRGLAHKLTSNFAWLVKHHREWSGHLYYHRARVWKPQLPPDSPEYSPPVLKINAKQKKQQRHAAFDLRAWGALGDIVHLAEGRDGVLLGKMTFPAKRA